MTREEIMKMANTARDYAQQTVHYYNGQFEGLTWEQKIEQARNEKFARLVAAHYVALLHQVVGDLTEQLDIARQRVARYEEMEKVMGWNQE